MLDYVKHFLLDRWAFDLADVVLVEQQPPQGFIVIQELLRDRLRPRVQFMSPTHVHARLGMPLLYPPVSTEEQRREIRKNFSEAWGRERLREFDINLGAYVRAHDITDAFMQLVVWIDDKRRSEMRFELPEEIASLYKSQKKCCGIL
jgi:hypothetical protein